MHCSLIIPVYNGAALTRRCLDRVMDEPRLAEVIVVDDGSTDITPRILAAYAGVKVIRHDVNCGFAASCNDGAEAAEGDALIFLNNDTLPQPGWLDALSAYAERNPEATVVGSKLLYPTGLVQHAGVVIGHDRMPRHLYAGFDGSHPAVNKSRRFQIVTAACALIRRAPFDEMRGFDTAFVNGYEDVDLCLRLGEAGHQIHYCHESVLVHLESVSEGRHTADDANVELYRSRWAERVLPDDMKYYVEDGLVELTYDHLYPIFLKADRRVALIDSTDTADQVLHARSQQVFSLLRENTKLKLARENSPDLRHTISPPSFRTETPFTASAERVVANGRRKALGKESSGTVVSVILPVKDGALEVEALFPLILQQHADVQIEFVAVDSGSEDETIETLRKFDSTVVVIDPAEFDHGETRNLGARHATGDILVFINKQSIPANELWLANLIAPLERDRDLAGVCSRVLPKPDADLLAYRDGMRDLSAGEERRVVALADRADYAELSPHALRAFLNFHTVSAAIRRSAWERFPFRRVATIGEDLLWAKEVVEAGLKLQHEPSSVVLHSHAYGYEELFQRNVDDGVANLLIVGRRLARSEATDLIAHLVRDDWAFLRLQNLAPSDLEKWQLISALRRTAQVCGQWVGANADGETAELAPLTSRVRRNRQGPAH